MIKPHGAATLTPLYVDDEDQRRKLCARAQTLPSVMLSSAGVEMTKMRT